MQCRFFFKHIALPAAVQAKADFVRATDNDELDANQLDNLRLALINDCRLFTAIRFKVPYTVKSRLNLEMFDAQLEYHKEEWISGKRHEGSPTDDPIK